MNKVRNFKWIPVLAFTVVLVPTLAFAGKLSYFLGERTWFSTGSSELSISGSGGTPNVLSELEWEDVDSVVVELTGEVINTLGTGAGPTSLGFYGILLRASGGFGEIRGGTLRDSDFLGNDRTNISSESLSTVDDDNLYYVNGDLGVRILNWWRADGDSQGYLDILIGGQYWQETYVATKGVQLKDPFGTVGFTGAFSDQGRNITVDFKWASLRVGARGEVPLPYGFSVRGGFIFIPWSHFVDVDVHHLRTDLQKDPSFRDEATGGFGVQVDATLSYNVWRGLSIEAGYQFWRFDSGDGDATTFALTGKTRSPTFNGATSTRHGAIVGFYYRFRP